MKKARLLPRPLASALLAACADRARVVAVEGSLRSRIAEELK